MNKNIGILTFEKFEGRVNIGSSRIRGRWLANNWDEAEIFKMGQKYDVTIYQKAYWLEHIKLNTGIKILDICDPDWRHWAYRVKQVADNVDAIVTSTEELAQSVRKFTKTKVVCIPDRIDLNEFKNKKVQEKKIKYAVWFGYSSNFKMLRPVVHHLIKRNIGLIVISDKSFNMQVNTKDKIDLIYYKFKEVDYKMNILQGDILLNPQSSKGKWKYKSENKTLIGQAIGLPVVKTLDELDKFISYENRIKEVENKNKELLEKWDIKYSIEEYKKLINEIKKGVIYNENK